MKKYRTEHLQNIINFQNPETENGCRNERSSKQRGETNLAMIREADHPTLIRMAQWPYVTI
jgi:hypothetical protein